MLMRSRRFDGCCVLLRSTIGVSPAVMPLRLPESRDVAARFSVMSWSAEWSKSGAALVGPSSDAGCPVASSEP